MFFWFVWLGLIAAVASYGLLPQMSLRSAVWLYACRTVRRPMRVCLLSVTTGTRPIGHAFKLYKPSVNSSGSRFFASRVINIWNSLPQSTDFSRVVLMLSNDQYVVLIFFRFWVVSSYYVYVSVLTSSTNYLSLLRADFLECTHQCYQIVLLYFILTSFFSFSLYGAVVSALRALLHPPRLL